MTMFYGYLAVEGPHDLSITGKLLRIQGLKQLYEYGDVDPFWHKLIPTKYPHKGQLVKPVPVPAFFQSSTHSIAISIAGSDSQLGNNIKGSLAVLEREQIRSVGAIADADKRPAKDQFDSVVKDLEGSELAVPVTPGEVVESTPNVGVYIFPDNVKVGTLETVLLQAGHETYQRLHMWATKAVNEVPISTLSNKEQKLFNKPAGRKKAQLAMMANVLRPGIAVQNTIRQDRWLTEKSVRLPLVASYRKFLIELFQLKAED